MADLGQGSKTGPEPEPAPAPAVAPSPYSPALKELLHDLEQQSLMNLEQCTDRLVQQIYQGAEGIRQKIRCTRTERGSTTAPAADSCYHCGQQGHYKRECPLRQKATPAVPMFPAAQSVPAVPAIPAVIREKRARRQGKRQRRRGSEWQRRLGVPTVPATHQVPAVSS